MVEVVQEMPKTRITLLFFFLLSLGWVAGIWIHDIHEDQQLRVVIEGPVAIYSDPDSATYEQLHSSPIRRLMPGDAVTVQRVTYGKDFMAIQLKTADGTVGWVVNDGSNVRVKRPNT